jgi:uncharacterized FlaG/YvyC family protein
MKELVEHVKQQGKTQRKRKRVAELDTKKREEQIENIEAKLEREKQQNASSKEQIDHAAKRIQSLELVRKSESKLLLKLLDTNCDWIILDLTYIAKSLNTCLDSLRTLFHVDSRRSMAQKFLSYLLKEAAPSKEDLLQIIKTIDSELSKVETMVAGLSTLEDWKILPFQ